MATLDIVLAEIRGLSAKISTIEKSQTFLSDNYDEMFTLLKEYKSANGELNDRLNANV